MKIKREPYRINIAQVTREIFDNDEDMGNEDYFLNETYSFSTLDDAERFLKELGYDLATIRWVPILSLYERVYKQGFPFRGARSFLSKIGYCRPLR